MGVEVWREYHLHTAAQSNKSPRVFLTSGYSCTRFFKENKYRNDVFLSGAKPKLMLKLTAFSVGRAVRKTVCMLLPTPQAVIFCCLLTSAAALNLYEQTGSCAAALLPAQLFFLLQSSANWPFFSPPPPDLKGLVFAKLLLSDSLLLEEFSIWSQEAGSLFIPQDQVLGGQLIFSPLSAPWTL